MNNRLFGIQVPRLDRQGRECGKADIGMNILSQAENSTNKGKRKMAALSNEELEKRTETLFQRVDENRAENQTLRNQLTAFQSTVTSLEKVMQSIHKQIEESARVQVKCENLEKENQDLKEEIQKVETSAARDDQVEKLSCEFKSFRKTLIWAVIFIGVAIVVPIMLAGLEVGMNSGVPVEINDG